MGMRNTAYKKPKITEIINITQEELDEIKANMKEGEKVDLFMDERLRITLFKMEKKVYEAFYVYGTKAFTEVFKDMLVVAGDKI